MSTYSTKPSSNTIITMLGNTLFDSVLAKYCYMYLHSCFNTNLGQIWTNPNVGLKNVISNFNFLLQNQLFLIQFLT